MPQPKIGETIETSTGEIARQRASLSSSSETSPLLSTKSQSARVDINDVNHQHGNISDTGLTKHAGASPFIASLSSALAAEIAYCTVSAGDARACDAVMLAWLSLGDGGLGQC